MGQNITAGQKYQSTCKGPQLYGSRLLNVHQPVKVYKLRETPFPTPPPPILSSYTIIWLPPSTPPGWSDLWMGEWDCDKRQFLNHIPTLGYFLVQGLFLMFFWLLVWLSPLHFHVWSFIQHYEGLSFSTAWLVIFICHLWAPLKLLSNFGFPPSTPYFDNVINE